MGMRILRKKNYEHTQGLTILSIVNSFCTNLKKICQKSNNVPQNCKRFDEILRFLEKLLLFWQKKNICLCNTVPDSLSRSLIFSIFTISLCIFFTGLEFGKKKRLFWWKKKFLSKQHCVKTAPSGVERKTNLREI